VTCKLNIGIKGFHLPSAVYTSLQVLAEVARRLHDQGVSAHRAMKELVPESDGGVDAVGLQKLFDRAGVKISKDRATRIMTIATKKPRLASFELVRLLAHAQQVKESKGMED